MARTGIDRIWTVPNAISFIRLVMVPVFLWLLVTGNDTMALIVLIIATTSDFVDGMIARNFNQVTRLGMYLDPLSDRLFIAASVIGLAIRGLIPLPLLAIILARDIMLLSVVLYRRLRIADFPRVTFVGKTATFVLFIAFPVVVLGTVWNDAPVPLELIGWLLGSVGAGIYWVAGFGYLGVLRRTIPGVSAKSEV
ncbi:MAG: CDP-alcohol phosphatidyltransferase family protein [Microbacteriaceae bacterium]|jgi:cardiolipin synthase|nr:CDP-alcohol phosphatidyltransferase family protein [Microbacteriaceae bacterium]